MISLELLRTVKQSDFSKAVLVVSEVSVMVLRNLGSLLKPSHWNEVHL